MFQDVSGGLSTSPQAPGAFYVGCSVMRLGHTEDSPPRLTVAPGAGGPVPPLTGREGAASTLSTAPGSGEVRAEGAVKLASAKTRATFAPSLSKPT